MSQATSSLDAFFASAPSLEPLRSAVEKGAASEAPVLILGGPGTGRSTLARAFHAASPRQPGPLVEMDVPSIPATLFESELFGHRAGAFTGAERGEPGRVGRAQGGTLVLDRVEELPLAVQPKLLRLVAEQAYAPLGGADRDADVRFVAIGPADLEQRVRTGQFRRDLYYRLEVLTVVLPTLAERIADLEPLIHFFLADLSARLGRTPPTLTHRAREWMSEYEWPGNVRQLRNVLERAIVLAEGDSIDPEPPPDAPEAPRSLAEVEREQIVAALRYTRGHQGRAAEILGISRKTLWEKRRRYELP